MIFSRKHQKCHQKCFSIQCLTFTVNRKFNQIILNSEFSYFTCKMVNTKLFRKAQNHKFARSIMPLERFSSQCHSSGKERVLLSNISQNTLISPNFLAQFPQSFGRNFHTRKLGEITAFYIVKNYSIVEAQLSFFSLFPLHSTSTHFKRIRFPGLHSQHQCTGVVFTLNFNSRVYSQYGPIP